MTRRLMARTSGRAIGSAPPAFIPSIGDGTCTGIAKAAVATGIDQRAETAGGEGPFHLKIKTALWGLLSMTGTRALIGKRIGLEIPGDVHMEWKYRIDGENVYTPDVACLPATDEDDGVVLFEVVVTNRPSLAKIVKAGILCHEIMVVTLDDRLTEAVLEDMRAGAGHYRHTAKVLLTGDNFRTLKRNEHSLRFIRRWCPEAPPVAAFTTMPAREFDLWASRAQNRFHEDQRLKEQAALDAARAETERLLAEARDRAEQDRVEAEARAEQDRLAWEKGAADRAARAAEAAELKAEQDEIRALQQRIDARKAEKDREARRVTERAEAAKWVARQTALEKDRVAREAMLLRDVHAEEIKHRGRILTPEERAETNRIWEALRQVYPDIRIENVGPDRVVGPWTKPDHVEGRKPGEALPERAAEHSSHDLLKAANDLWHKRNDESIKLFRKAQKDRAKGLSVPAGAD
jgi:hypothetical protein